MQQKCKKKSEEGEGKQSSVCVETVRTHLQSPSSTITTWPEEAQQGRDARSRRSGESQEIAATYGASRE